MPDASAPRNMASSPCVSALELTAERQVLGFSGSIDNEQQTNCQTLLHITAFGQNGQAHRRTMSATLQKLIDAKEAAEILGITPETLYKYARVGIVPSIKFGDILRFDYEALREWIRTGSRAGAR
jgi:excisionase family DNA binding protein